jgi:hydrogenase-1 operon protein HyaE
MTIPMPLAAGADPLGYPLIAQLFTRHGFAALDAANFDAAVGRPRRTLLAFLEDPVRIKETLDLAVIVPELVRAFPGRFAVGVLLPAAARALQPRFGFRIWPAIVMLADGNYVGAIEGLRNWDEYVARLAELIEAAPTRPPTVGIAVSGSGGHAASCHS